MDSTIIIKNDDDYRGQLSPFRNEVNGNIDKNVLDASLSTALKNKNNFTLSDYCWMPEDADRYFNNDYSWNAIPQDNSTWIFGNITIGNISKDSLSFNNITRNIGSIANKTAEYATTQASGVINSVKNTINGKSKIDKKFVSNNILAKEMASIPKAIISEFQPNNKITESISKISAIFEAAESFFDNKGNRLEILKQLTSKSSMKKIIGNAMGLTDKQLETFDYDSTRARIIDIPNFFYQNMIGGYFTARYEIPFSNQSAYLKGQGSQGWESRALKERLMGPLAGLTEKISDVMSAFDIASKPKWTLNGGGPVFDSISCEFHLFNYNINALIKNFKFVHTLVPGNMWYQEYLLQRSSALYDIEIPGRYRFYLCKGDISSEFVGKIRRAPAKFINWIKSSSSSWSSGLRFTMNENAYLLVPDAYKIILEFTPLVPNNFNMYMNYLMKDVNSKMSSAVGDVRRDISGALINSVISTQEEIAAQLKDTTASS